MWRKRAFNVMVTGHDTLVQAAHGVRRRKSTTTSKAEAEVELSKMMSNASVSSGDVEKIKELMAVTKGDDGRFHMFVSQFVGGCGFNQWGTNSRVVHATDDTGCARPNAAPSAARPCA